MEPTPPRSASRADRLLAAISVAEEAAALSATVAADRDAVRAEEQRLLLTLGRQLATQFDTLDLAGARFTYQTPDVPPARRFRAPPEPTAIDHEDEVRILCGWTTRGLLGSAYAVVIGLRRTGDVVVLRRADAFCWDVRRQTFGVLEVAPARSVAIGTRCLTSSIDGQGTPGIELLELADLDALGIDLDTVIHACEVAITRQLAAIEATHHRTQARKQALGQG